MEYFLHWIDEYTNGHRRGVSHATPDNGINKSLCGIDYDKHNIDGGYHTIKRYSPECKKCLKALGKIEN